MSLGENFEATNPVFILGRGTIVRSWVLFEPRITNRCLRISSMAIA